MNNYELQQYFLNYIKEFAISNPDKYIDSDFVYSILEVFNIRNDQYPKTDISYMYSHWLNRYNKKTNMEVFEYDNRPFLYFQTGKITGNEVKLYIPMDINHLEHGADKLFDFISANNIVHQSKIAKVIRTDNIVVRVTTIDDALKILNFVSNDSYIKEGMLKVNPFLPNYNGMGIAMDNFTSYNYTVAQIISNYLDTLRRANRLDLFTVEGLNQYIKNCLMNEQYIKDQAYYEKIEPLDLKDIYTILSKVTDRDFKLENFMEFISDKIVDKYSNKNRITDPKYYFDQAIKAINKKMPGNTKEAIKQYLRGNPLYFTNDEYSRQGLIKYMPSYNVINTMRTELSKNNVPIPHTDDELIDSYLNILFRSKINNQVNRQVFNNGDYYFDVIKNAYLNTLNKYGIKQAMYALKVLILNKNIRYFTNSFKDRDRLATILNKDIKRIIMFNININSDNIDQIVSIFDETVNVKQSAKQNK